MQRQLIEDIRTVIAKHNEQWGYDPPETLLVKELRGGFLSNGYITRRWRVSGDRRRLLDSLREAGFVVYRDPNNRRTTRIGMVSDPAWQGLVYVSDRS